MHNNNFPSHFPLFDHFLIFPRSSSSGPRDAFIIMDCINIDMLREDITKDLYFAKGRNSITFKSNESRYLMTIIHLWNLKKAFFADGFRWRV